MISCINGCGSMAQVMYEGVEIDTCNACSGVWLDAGELTTIVETKEDTWSADVIKKVLELTGKQGVSEEERSRCLLCPECGSKLLPTNYQNNSGIIVNACQNNHGVWLDSEEISKIQIYMEKWDEIAKENSHQYQEILKDIKERHNERSDLLGRQGPSRFEIINRFLSKIAELI